jgi:hypothetical protein
MTNEAKGLPCLYFLPIAPSVDLQDFQSISLRILADMPSYERRSQVGDSAAACASDDILVFHEKLQRRNGVLWKLVDKLIVVKPTHARCPVPHQAERSQKKAARANADDFDTICRSCIQVFSGLAIYRLFDREETANDNQIVKFPMWPQPRCRRDLDSAARFYQMPGAA